MEWAEPVDYTGQTQRERLSEDICRYLGTCLPLHLIDREEMQNAEKWRGGAAGWTEEINTKAQVKFMQIPNQMLMPIKSPTTRDGYAIVSPNPQTTPRH